MPGLPIIVRNQSVYMVLLFVNIMPAEEILGRGRLPDGSPLYAPPPQRPTFYKDHSSSNLTAFVCRARPSER